MSLIEHILSSQHNEETIPLLQKIIYVIQQYQVNPKFKYIADLQKLRQDIHTQNYSKEQLDKFVNKALEIVDKLIKFDSDFINLILDDEKYDQQFCQKMIDREIELRLSDEYQKKMGETEFNGSKDWMDIAEEIQIHIVKEFGFSNIKQGLRILRTATQKYNLERVPFYVKYNRAIKGKLEIGSIAPNPSVHICQSHKIKKLFPFPKQDHITFVFAGAIT